MRHLTAFIVLVFILAACAAPATPVPTAIPTSTSTPAAAITPAPTVLPALPLVKVNGLGFTVDDRPFRFIGANAIYFGYYQEYGFSIEEAIKAAKENGITVLRIYLGYGEGTWGDRPFEEYDKVLDIAARNGMYVIANLTDGCCLKGNETRDAYLSRLPYVNMTSDSSLTSFEGYIKSVLLRRNTVNGRIYRDDPTILAWDVANEPAVELFSDAELNAWLSKITTYIKTQDPNHLVTIGVACTSNIYNSPGAHYQALNVPGLDFFSFHYNLPDYNSVAGNLDSIRYRVERLRSMGKPVVLEEFGVGSGRILPGEVSADTLNDWLRAYKDQMETAFSAGVSGAMFWGWGVPGTKTVLLWWRIEDHDSSETEFTRLMREYQMPPAPAAPEKAAIVVPPQPTAALPQPVYVKAFCTLIGTAKQTHVDPGTPIVIVWGWSSKTAAQMQDFLDNDNTTVALDGKVISAEAPYSVTSNDPGSYELVWFAQVGMLSAGTHRIVFDESWKQMISDGTNTYGPGGKVQTQHDECEIIVG